ncbi:TadE/TadG family type IV pilus assembly protein [Brevibacterium litoralis]|uniref:TadE/TadG family type IV pilus assembly protein n=1 Tax=Brevibacterium litoralis TaxID=3138935 RepID=UPI0032EC4CC9
MHPRRTPARRRDAGAAVTDFVLVGTLLALVFAAVLQFGLALHVRNTVVDAAIAGARVGAMVDAGPEAGRAHTRMLLTGSLGSAYAKDVSVTRTVEAGLPVVTVTVRAPLPVLGPLGPAGAWELSGRALDEGYTG